MTLIIVGATGLVGQMMLKVLETSKVFENVNVIPVASQKSAGKTISFKGRELLIRTVEDAINSNAELALFSAGASVSKHYAPEFVKNKIKVIDNSSAWRSEPDIPLIVPEINAKILRNEDMIISNPNCSTIQMLVAIAPLHEKWKIRRIVVSTYQSVTGSGMKGLQQLMDERQNIKGEKAYPYPIDLNLIPQGGDFLSNKYTSEEMKLHDETRKILNDNSIAITSTVVRVPVTGGHSESVNLEFEKPFDLKMVVETLKQSKGISLIDEPAKQKYPMPLFSEGTDDVFVGRIRKDFSIEYGINLWIVSDNLRKGAATNAVQIAEYMKENNLI